MGWQEKPGIEAVLAPFIKYFLKSIMTGKLYHQIFQIKLAGQPTRKSGKSKNTMRILSSAS
jgi:hypothetical protein